MVRAQLEHFEECVLTILELHRKKSLDYGRPDDPYANVRASEDFGVPPWIGALLRLNDKVHRLQQYARRGWLANENAEDSMLDIAVYAIIAWVLYREASGLLQPLPIRALQPEGEPSPAAREPQPAEIRAGTGGVGRQDPPKTVAVEASDPEFPSGGHEGMKAWIQEETREIDVACPARVYAHYAPEERVVRVRQALQGKERRCCGQ